MDGVTVGVQEATTRKNSSRVLPGCPEGYKYKKGTFESDPFITVQGKDQKVCADRCNQNTECIAFYHIKQLDMCKMFKLNTINQRGQGDLGRCVKTPGKKNAYYDRIQMEFLIYRSIIISQ